MFHLVQASITKYYKIEGLAIKNVFPTVLEDRKSKVKVLYQGVSPDEGSFLQMVETEL